MKRLLYIFILLTVYSAPAHSQDQEPLSSKDLRHALGDGPNPIYVIVQGNVNFNPAYTDFLKQYATSEGLKYKKGYAGYDITLGSVFKSPFKLPGNKNVFGGELGFRDIRSHTYRSGDETFCIHQNTLSLRAAYRMNLMYPFTTQFQAGPILFDNYIVTETDKNDSKNQSKNLYTSALLPGMDIRAKVLFLDPAGTDGGYGGFLGLSYYLLWDRRSIDAIYADYLPGSDKQKMNYTNFSISAGFIIPIGIRIL